MANKKEKNKIKKKNKIKNKRNGMHECYVSNGEK